MKEIKLPGEGITLHDNVQKVDRTHTALEVLEDAVMGRAAWRVGHGPKHAGIVFAAFDKAVKEGTARLRLPDATYTFMLEQVALDPGTSISPRSANRFYLKIARAITEAEEIDEEPATKENNAKAANVKHA